MKTMKNVYPDCKRAHKNEECSTSVTIVNFLLKYLSYTQIHTHLVINQEYLFLYILRFIIFEDFAYSFTVSIGLYVPGYIIIHFVMLLFKIMIFFKLFKI